MARPRIDDCWGPLVDDGNFDVRWVEWLLGIAVFPACPKLLETN